jgi:tRNA-2-methylthio-N6-dimethylallyladenosine synthase
VLFEKRGRHAGQIAGRSPYLQAVHAEGPPSLIGKIAEVAIETLEANSLGGCLAEKPLAGVWPAPDLSRRGQASA